MATSGFKIIILKEKIIKLDKKKYLAFQVEITCFKILYFKYKVYNLDIR